MVIDLRVVSCVRLLSYLSLPSSHKVSQAVNSKISTAAIEMFGLQRLLPSAATTKSFKYSQLSRNEQRENQRFHSCLCVLVLCLHSLRVRTRKPNPSVSRVLSLCLPFPPRCESNVVRKDCQEIVKMSSMGDVASGGRGSNYEVVQDPFNKFNHTSPSAMQRSMRPPHVDHPGLASAAHYARVSCQRGLMNTCSITRTIRQACIILVHSMQET